MNKLALNEKITLTRNRKKISQKYLAELTGIHLTTISKYESGHIQPSIEALLKIARALELSTDYLLFDDYEEIFSTPINDKELLELAAKIDRMPEAIKNKYKNMTKSFVND